VAVQACAGDFAVAVRYRRRVAISLLAGTLRSFATRSMASRSSANLHSGVRPLQRQAGITPTVSAVGCFLTERRAISANRPVSAFSFLP
jgi:hypothetical protein